MLAVSGRRRDPVESSAASPPFGAGVPDRSAEVRMRERRHPPRYAPDQPLPPYPYLPGRDPHPTRDPHGHSYAQPETAPEPLVPERWCESIAFLLGVDLYNRGYHWEAHEAWESLWLHPHDVIQRELLQALVQAAAAAVQERKGNTYGRQRLAARAVRRLRRVAAHRGRRWMGIELERFAAALEEFARDGGVPPPLWLREGTFEPS